MQCYSRNATVPACMEICSRLHQGGELSDTKEIAAVGELEVSVMQRNCRGKDSNETT